MAATVPSLSPSGWLSNIGEKADLLFSHYLASDYSQTYCYEREVSSLAKHIQLAGNNPLRLQTTIEDGLKRYFGRYFQATEVSVMTHLPDPNDPDKINIRVDINVFENGYRYNLGKEIQTVKSKLIGVIDIVNG